MAVKGAVSPDISSWNPPLTIGFERDFLIFRACDGNNFLDPNFLGNAAIANLLYQEGHIAGAVCYQVYRPVPVASMYDWFWHAIGPKVPVWLKAVMTDAESWGGAIRGDHSAPLNQLVGRHAHQMGTWSGALGYGNASDLATLWANRDKRIKVVVASYGPKIIVNSIPGAIGQQYTDGTGRWDAPAGLPISSKELGRVDHNVFPGFVDGKALAQFLRPAPTPPPAPKPVPPPVPAPAPKPAPGKHRLYPAGSATLTAAGREYQVVLGDQGHLRLFHDGTQVGEFQLVRPEPGTPNTPAN